MSLENNVMEESGNFSTRLLMFNWVEYLVFSAMLGISALIGIYYGCYKGNQNTVSEYMQGGKKMAVFPITMSLIASHVSGTTLLGLPTEIYSHGTQYVATVFCCVIVSIFIVTFYLPVFYKLQLNTPYEGGLKAVVWTDAFQSVFIFGSAMFVIIAGCITAGGPTKVFETNYNGGRLELFNLDPNPLHRSTFWTVTIGTSFSSLARFAVHPGAIQRFTAVPTYKNAVTCIWWHAIGIIVIDLLTAFIGLLIYTRYHDCDPVASKIIKQGNQILPLYVTDVAGKLPGLTGLLFLELSVVL